MDSLAPEPRRPRPVAGLPALDARAVAKAWLVELVAGATLEEAAALPAADLAREGPGLCAAVVGALSDDAALRRLAPGGNLAWLSARAAELAGSAGGGGAVRAAEALRRATQAAILAEARLDAATTAELADRLAHVCSLVAEAAAGGARGPVEPARSSTPVSGPTAEPPPEPGDHEPPPEPPGPGYVLPREGSDDPADALRARDRRRAQAGSLDVALQRRLARHAQDASPFALLAIEADGVERLRAAQAAGEVDELLEALERALAAELRPADQLLRAEPGRYWVTAPDTGPTVARLLAERLADGARAAAVHRGAPLTVSIGVATCPEDGDDARELAERADRAVFAARAAGTPVA